ncbi:MAG TPA: hypothetical protein VFP94_07015 [Terriglobales bacterium]|nr:hypothetical protein [Terriglobales bacterium]
MDVGVGDGTGTVPDPETAFPAKLRLRRDHADVHLPAADLDRQGVAGAQLQFVENGLGSTSRPALSSVVAAIGNAILPLVPA